MCLRLFLFRGEPGNCLDEQKDPVSGEKEKRRITENEMNGEKRLDWERIK